MLQNAPATRGERHARDRPFRRRQGGQGRVRAVRRRVQPQYRRGPGQSRLRLQGRGRADHRQCGGRAAGLGRDQPAAARAGHVQVPGADPEGRREPRQAAFLRARQDARRLQGRHPARRRGGRVRLRHPASDEGRVHRGRRARHRPLFDAPAARRGRRHHAVQFPGHDPDVEIRAGARLRQRLHPQAVGARLRRCRCGSRSCCSRPDCRPACSTSSTATRRRSIRCSPIRACAAIGFVGSSAIAEYIYRDRLRARQARAVLRRRQEPHDRDAGRRHGPGGRCADRRRLRLGRRALHGDLGRGAGRQEDRRRADGQADPARREPQDRAVDRHRGRLRPDGHARAPRQGEELCRARHQGRREASRRWPQFQAAGL